VNGLDSRVFIREKWVLYHKLHFLRIYRVREPYLRGSGGFRFRTVFGHVVDQPVAEGCSGSENRIWKPRCAGRYACIDSMADHYISHTVRGTLQCSAGPIRIAASSNQVNCEELSAGEECVTLVALK
jgi:hypothetical protein